MPLSPLRGLSGWTRLAVFLTASWAVAVLGTVSWEYLTKNPLDYLEYRREKLFFMWVQDLLANTKNQGDTSNLFFKLKTHQLLIALLVPVASIWLSLLVLIPCFHWIRAGFIVDGQSKYLLENRLADVLALIQVLAIDDSTHRTEKGLLRELQATPKSSVDWNTIATDHPEFFRVKPDSKFPISLIARHVASASDNGQRTISLDYVGKLLQTAVDLHDRQVRRAQWWHILVPLLVALLAGVVGLIGIITK